MESNSIELSRKRLKAEDQNAHKYEYKCTI